MSWRFFKEQDILTSWRFLSCAETKMLSRGVKVKLNPMKTDGSFHGRTSSLPCEIPLSHPERHMTVSAWLRDGC